MLGKYAIHASTHSGRVDRIMCMLPIQVAYVCLPCSRAPLQGFLVKLLGHRPEGRMVSPLNSSLASRECIITGLALVRGWVGAEPATALFSSQSRRSLIGESAKPFAGKERCQEAQVRARDSV
jgi:hypothetical protein